MEIRFYRVSQAGVSAVYRFGRKTLGVVLLAVLYAICVLAEPTAPGTPEPESPVAESPVVESPVIETPKPESPEAIIHEAEIHEPEPSATEPPEEKPEVSPTFYSSILSANSDSKIAGPAANPRNGSEGIPLFLLNRNGRMIAVPGISLETMDDVFRKIVGAPTDEKVQLPEYIFHSVLVDGEVGKDVVSLKVRFQIETFGQGAVCVPLRFDEGILVASQTTETKPAAEPKPTPEKKPAAETKPAPEPKPATGATPSVSTADSLSEENSEGEATEIYSEAAHRLNELVPVEKRYSGPGQVWVEFSEENGFTAWIVGKGVHKIELTFQVPYTRAQSGESQFKIQIPYATMSELNLEIQQTRKESEHLAVSMTGGTMLRSPYFEVDSGTDSSRPESEGKTRLSVIRLGGEFWLSWSEAPEEKAVTPDILEAEGLILAIISQDSVHYDARMKVTRKNSDVNSFRVQLPVNAELIPQNSSDYSIAYVLNEKGKIEKGGTSGGPLVEVTLKKKFTGTVRVDIHAKLPISSPQAASEWFDMAGFSVLSAVRQAGYYAIKTTIGKHANWTPGAGMRRLEELPVPMELWEPVKNLEVGKAAGNSVGAIVYKSASEEKKTGKTGTDSKDSGAAGAAPKDGSPLDESEDSGESSLDQLLSNIPQDDGAKPEKEDEDPYIPFNRGNDSQIGESLTDGMGWESVENRQSVWEAVFEYDSQPTPLWTRMVERTTRINIEPQYTVSVTQDKLVLEATWNCTIRGGKISWIDVNLNGWTFLSCGPESLTASEQINDISPSGSTSANISIPFNQPVGNHVILTFRAERELPEDAKDFEFRLPQKSGSQVPQFVFSSTPAELRIVSVPQLEVTPDSSKCRRLVRQPGSLTTPKNSESGGSIPLVYRCESEEAVFAANLLVHERQTQVRQYSQVELYRQEYRVRQTFSYAVAYKSINQLHFLIPDINVEDLEFTLSAGTTPENRSGKGFDAVSVPAVRERNFISMKVPMEKVHSVTIAADDAGPSAGSRNTGMNRSGTAANAAPETGSAGIPEASGSGEAAPVLETVPVPGMGPESPDGPGENPESPNENQPLEPDQGRTPEHSSEPGLAPGEISSRPILKFRPSEEKPGFMEVDALLPEELLGAFTISIAYTKPMPRLSEGTPINVEIPLASSQDGKTTENLLELAADESLEMNSPKQQNAESPWEEMGTFLVQNQFRREKEFGEKPRNIPLQFLCKADGVQNFINVGVSLRSVSPQEITLIDRCWIQTWISGENRRDRAVFLFPPAEIPGMGTGSGNDGTPLAGGSGPSLLTIRKFTVCLPKNALADTAEVWIDQKPAQLGKELKRLSPNKIQVILPVAAAPHGAQSVEIRYQFRVPNLSEGTREMELPYVEDSTWIRSLYWQILLPENLHIAQVPQGFSLEYRWGWNQCFWGRVPLWEQETLERWSGAVKGTPIPKRMNRYILAGMGANEVLERPIHMRLVNRTTLVTFLALIVYLGGILMIYLEIFQKPLIRLGLFALLAGLAIRFPEYALLGIQAATLGFFLFFISIMCGLRKQLRHQIFVRGSSEAQTRFKTQGHQTVVAPSESSQHAFRTISFDQNPGAASGDEVSTVIRQVKKKRPENG